MNPKRSHLRLPAALAAGSFLCLALLGLLTSPAKNVSWAVIFFAALLIWMVSLGHLLISLQMGSVSLKNRYRIWLVSLFILVFLMFRSAQSLNWIDAVVLILVTFGMLFYSGRRAH